MLAQVTFLTMQQLGGWKIPEADHQAVWEEATSGPWGHGRGVSRGDLAQMSIYGWGGQ